MEAIIISDLHLGSSVCQDRCLINFLEDILSENIKTEQLILNGDVFDSHDFRRLNKHHWKVLSLLRKLSDKIKVIWICGNHDGPAEIISHLIGVEVANDYIVESGGNRILILHGHQFDKFIEKRPLLTKLADLLYRFLQRIDTSHTIARMAKHGSKTFLRCVEQIEEKAIVKMREMNCDAVCCGHVHVPIEKQFYFNSGCWTELPCSYLIIKNGEICLKKWKYNG